MATTSSQINADIECHAIFQSMVFKDQIFVVSFANYHHLRCISLPLKISEVLQHSNHFISAQKYKTTI
jgi:hypothetical protein